MIEYFASFYWAVPIQLLLNVLFIVGAIYHFKKLRHLKVLFVYSCFTLAQTIAGIYINVYARFDVEKEQALNDSVQIFAVIELIYFYIFIFRSIKSRVAKKIIVATMLMFAIMNIANWMKYKGFKSGMGAIEAYLIIVACLYYYCEILFYSIKTPIKNNAIFWSITGMFFLSIISTPIFIQEKYIYVEKYVITRAYITTFIGYISLFILLLNALKCQVQPVR